MKEWLHKNAIRTPEELKKMSTYLQRYARIFGSIKADPDSGILMLESAPNEHFEMDKFRILLPKALNNQVIRRCTNHHKKDILLEESQPANC